MSLVLWLVCASGSGDPAPLHEWGDFDASAEFELGWRAVSLGGNRSEFDEAFGFASGAFLRSATLELARARGTGAIDGFDFELAGLGEPRRSARLDVDGAEFEARGRYTRTEFSGGTDTDVHAIETRRERASVEFAPGHGRSHDVATSLQLTWTERESFSNLSRSVDFGSVSPVPTARRDRELGVETRTTADVAGWALELSARARRAESRDQRAFALPSPSAPAVTQTEDFDGALDCDALGGGVRISRSIGACDLTGAVDYDEFAGDGAMTSYESGVLIDPTDPFRRRTDGELDVGGRRFAAELDARWHASEGTTLFVRGLEERETNRDTLDRHVVLNENGSVSVLDLTDVGRVHFETEIVEFGTESDLSNAATFWLTGRTGRTHAEHYETVQGTVSRDFDGDLQRWGGEAQLELEPLRRAKLSFDVGTGIEPTHNTFEGTGFEYAEDHASWASARLRWGRPGGTEWHGTCSHRAGANDAFGSESRIDALTVACSGEPARGVFARASATWRRVELSAHTVILVGFQQYRAIADYSSDQWSFAGQFAWDATPRLQPRVDATTTFASSDGGFSASTLEFALPWQISPRATLGLELALYDVEADADLDLGDHRAAVAAITFRAAP